jgi:hypothetical protein
MKQFRRATKRKLLRCYKIVLLTMFVNRMAPCDYNVRVLNRIIAKMFTEVNHGCVTMHYAANRLKVRYKIAKTY